MIDTELKQLAAEPPDHPLEALEAEIWGRVRAREQSLRASRRLLALQALILAAGLIASILAGQHSHRMRRAEALDVFSPQMPWSASTLLAGSQS